MESKKTLIKLPKIQIKEKGKRKEKGKKKQTRKQKQNDKEIKLKMKEYIKNIKEFQLKNKFNYEENILWIKTNENIYKNILNDWYLKFNEELIYFKGLNCYWTNYNNEKIIFLNIIGKKKSSIIRVLSSIIKLFKNKKITTNQLQLKKYIKEYEKDKDKYYDNYYINEEKENDINIKEINNNEDDEKSSSIDLEKSSYENDDDIDDDDDEKEKINYEELDLEHIDLEKILQSQMKYNYINNNLIEIKEEKKRIEKLKKQLKEIRGRSYNIRL